MLKQDRWRLIIMVVVVALSAVVVFPIKDKVHLGLDLSGGAHIVLQASNADGSELHPDSLDQLLVVLRNRVDQYGVTEPLLQKQGRDRVIVDLPGVEDPQAALDLIGRTAMLEFRPVLQSSAPLPPQAQRPNYDSDEEYQAAVERWNAYRDQQEAQKNRLIEDSKDDPNLLVASDDDGSVYLLGQVYLTGRELRDARPQPDQLGRPSVSIDFTSQGAQLFDEATAATVGRQLAMVLDGKVISAPRVNERISGGQAQITGRFSSADARNLSIMLRAGALPVNVEILENRSVGPSLGADSVEAGYRAGFIGLVAVFLFMVVVYRVRGLTADISLLTTLLTLFAQLILVKATLTMPGIAGIILTIGMAVDSNILIFERIKEEEAAGKTAYAAMTAGFSRAFTTILDSNVTTVVAAAALYYYGSGPLRGFALTLTLGIIASLFSALIVNRVLLHFLVSRSAGARVRA